MYRAVLGEVILAEITPNDGWRIKVPSNPTHVLTNNVYMSVEAAKEAAEFLVPLPVRHLIRWIED